MINIHMKISIYSAIKAFHLIHLQSRDFRSLISFNWNRIYCIFMWFAFYAIRYNEGN